MIYILVTQFLRWRLEEIGDFHVTWFVVVPSHLPVSCNYSMDREGNSRINVEV